MADTQAPPRFDISHTRLPKAASALGAPSVNAPPIPVSRPPEYEPPPGTPEIIISWSIIAPGVSTSPLFTSDANGNVTAGAALKLPDNTRARISGVVIEGDTPLGTPVLTFSLRGDVNGATRIPGWGGVALPGRGGITSLGLDVWTIIPVGSFFGAFVVNSDGAAHYAAITVLGWLL